MLPIESCPKEANKFSFWLGTRTRSTENQFLVATKADEGIATALTLAILLFKGILELVEGLNNLLKVVNSVQPSLVDVCLAQWTTVTAAQREEDALVAECVVASC
jgi:hypothetical protein